MLLFSYFWDLEDNPGITKLTVLPFNKMSVIQGNAVCTCSDIWNRTYKNIQIFQNKKMLDVTWNSYWFVLHWIWDITIFSKAKYPNQDYPVQNILCLVKYILESKKIGKLVKRNWHMNERRINLFIFCENEIVSSLLTMAVYLKLHGRV